MNDKNIISMSNFKLGLNALTVCINNVIIVCEGLGVSLQEIFRIEFNFESILDNFLFWLFICLVPSDDS